jgi:hypothetical protein
MTDLNEFLLKLSNDLGFNHIACWNIKNKEPLTTYPLEWTQHYTEHKLNELDHTLINHFKKPRPFIWGDSLMNRLNENKKKVFIEAKKFDLNSGFSIPVIGEDGIKSIVNFASKEKQKHAEKKVFHIYDKFIIANLIDTLAEKKHNKNKLIKTMQEIDEIFFYNKKLIKKDEDTSKKLINIINNKILISKHKNIKNCHEQSILNLIEIKNLIIKNM